MLDVLTQAGPCVLHFNIGESRTGFGPFQSGKYNIHCFILRTDLHPHRGHLVRVAHSFFIQSFIRYALCTYQFLGTGLPLEIQKSAKEKPQPSGASEGPTVKQAISVLCGQHHGQVQQSKGAAVQNLVKRGGVFLDKLSSRLRHFRVWRRLSR